MSALAGDMMVRKSAPVGTMAKRSLTKVSNALSPTHPLGGAHGLTDSTFLPATNPDLSGLDAQTAATLSTWAANVVKGSIQLPAGTDYAAQLARDIDVLSTARVSDFRLDQCALYQHSS